VESFLLDLAIGSVFGEGLMLFSAFAIILAFTRIGTMSGLAQLTTFIARDEDLHTEVMCKLFNVIKEENRKVWVDSFKKRLYEACRTVILLEDHFIDLAYKVEGDLPVAKDDLKEYIRWLADQRLAQIGLKKNYKIKTNPLPWIEDLLNSTEHANFFEVRPSNYSKINIVGDWSTSFD
jgi:ribonucleoside-diphosphate reductase beta chain